MARLDVLFGSFDNARTPLRGLRRAEVTSCSAGEVTLTAGASVFTIAGSGFTQDASGNVTGGTVTAIAERSRGVLLYTLSELTIPAVDLARWIDRNRNADFLDAAYGGDDVLNGASGKDRLSGFAGADLL